jgi:hypothetical protein
MPAEPPATPTLPTLIARALAAQEAAGDDDAAEDRAGLLALHDRATDDTFTHAAALVAAADWPRRRLGLRILKELGGDERPFADRTLDLLLPRLASPDSADERHELIRTIGWQGRPRALDALLALAGDRDVLVRYLVAHYLPGCALLARANREPSGSDDEDEAAAGQEADPRAVAALVRLTKDADADVRWYATAAFETDFPLVDTPAVRAALKARLADSDPGVAECARNALETRGAK